MIIKTIKVGDKEVRMGASASIPRLYRIKFRRDIMKDMQALKKVKDRYTIDDLTVFENIAYIMAKHAGGAEIPDTPEDWLDEFDGVFDIYTALPQMIELWGINEETASIPKKKAGQPSEK